MSDGALVLVACAAWCGALLARPLPLVLVVAILGLATVGLAVSDRHHDAAQAPGSGRVALAVVAVGLLASVLAARSWSGLEPAAAGAYEGTVTLLSDPAPVGSAVRADVRVSGRHLEAWFHGSAAGEVRSRLAGERLILRGAVTPRRAGADNLVARHIVGRLSVAEVIATSDAAWPYRLANRVRRTLHDGLDGLAPEERALVLGVVVGDDREQSIEVTDEFGAAGLRHLLAVSGQNVAFVLVAVGPILRRAGLRTRFLLTLAVLLGFALVTRFEPSVLRATAMAAVAATATWTGRPAHPLRYLAAAVATLVLVDPLLVHALGFQLSVGACAAILLLAGPLASALPGPRLIAEPLAVTIAAQLGVAPLLVHTFGGVPLAGVPANLVAAPAVAPLTVWGLVVGLAAGALGIGRTAIVGLGHLPTRILARWLLWDAHVAAHAGLGELDGRGVVVVTAVGAALLAWHHRRTR